MSERNIIRYTNHCSCFYDNAEKDIVYYNETKDCEIARRKEENKDVAIAIMRKWVKDAPLYVICVCLD